MLHIRDDFKNRFRIPAEEFNKVARFINNLVGGAFIDVQKGDSVGTQSPVAIDIKIEKLKEVDFGYAKTPAKKVNAGGEVDESDDAYADRCAPKTVRFVVSPEEESASEKIARMGTRQTAARVDHEHLIPFWINPTADGDDGTDNGGENVPSEDIYVPEEDEDTSDLDLSGSSPRAARADHTHKLPFHGVTQENKTIFLNIHKPVGTYNLHGTPVTIKIENGIITEWEEGNDVDLTTLTS